MCEKEKRLAQAMKDLVTEAESTPECPEWIAVPSDVFHEMVNAYLASRGLKETTNISKELKSC